MLDSKQGLRQCNNYSNSLSLYNLMFWKLA